ncbi:putative ankyrin repeat protein [Acanthamoeba castellanii mimivirus]|uniref:Putative ankyrin repeat protein L284 n=5 Tax=Mimivirus TaxID=315393 RepID=YL284_MIMIV|nr:putative ankyrin repeat protein [Acanthamoeba polyphaga mimivirus]Q5UPW3.1 RecName: Full=Putative ankyrin repeat protein L284 [Acanthamoeba polyphaga mimivirus]AHJ40015.1 hypothetical protein [Samba virus]ALR83865.1 ankyrin repeat protein [Niemeyer virus]AMZ02733.1 putative ankyrin repeat protein [Mimivirus Bombay]BAV61383.1 putative ankyrin repeat protein [Acanthamoeba castellanii mimivirus]AAV50556.1 unknown [Acanthamoeba polyphaga mimivirus]
MEFSNQLFMITGCPEQYHHKSLKTGLNILTKKSFDKYGGFILFEAKNIPPYYFGHYLRMVSLPSDRPDLIVYESKQSCRSNMVILGEIFLLSTQHTFIMLNDFGLDIKSISAQDRGKWYECIAGSNSDAIKGHFLFQKTCKASDEPNIIDVDDSNKKYKPEINHLDESNILKRAELLTTVTQSLSTGDAKMAGVIINKNDILDDILTLIIKSGNVSAFKTLINIIGLSNDQIFKIIESSFSHNQTKIYEFLESRYPQLYLESSIINGRTDIVDNLVKKGSNPIVVLHKAAECAQFDIIWNLSENSLINQNDIDIAMTIVKQRIHDILFYSDNPDVEKEQDILELLENIKLMRDF